MSTLVEQRGGRRAAPAPLTPPRQRRRVPVTVLRLGLLAVLLGVWQLSSGRLVDPFYLPAPSEIWQSLVTSASAGQLWSHIWITVEEAMIGFGAGTVAALLTGILLTRNRRLADVLDPFLAALNATPRVALGPLFVVWFGIGLLSKVILVVTLVFFIVFYNTFQGLRDVDRNYLRVAQVMGTTRAQLFRKVILPAAMPWIVVGIKLSVPYALIGAVIGEFIAASSGLGYAIKLASNTYDTAGTMAGIFVLMALAVALNLALDRLARRILFWQPEAEDKGRASGI